MPTDPQQKNTRPAASRPEQEKHPESKRSLFDWRYILLISIVLLLGFLAIYFSPIKQSRNFYDYADHRLLAGNPPLLGCGQ